MPKRKQATTPKRVTKQKQAKPLPSFLDPTKYIGPLFMRKDYDIYKVYSLIKTDLLLGSVKEEDWFFLHEPHGPLYAQVIDEDVVFRVDSPMGRMVGVVELQYWHPVMHLFSKENVHYHHFQQLLTP
jgi:hypothetical protein